MAGSHRAGVGRDDENLAAVIHQNAAHLHRHQPVVWAEYEKVELHGAIRIHPKRAAPCDVDGAFGGDGFRWVALLHRRSASGDDVPVAPGEVLFGASVGSFLQDPMLWTTGVGLAELRAR